MKITVTALLLLSAFTTRAQDAIEPIPLAQAEKKLSVGLTASPEWGYRSLAIAESNPAANTWKTFRDEQEVAHSGWTAGFALTYRFSRHFSLETGLQYAVKGYRTRDFAYADPFDLLGISGNKLRLSYRRNYLELPLGLGFETGAGALRFRAAAGLTLSALTKAETTSRLETTNAGVQRSTTTDSGYNAVYLGAYLSAGAELRLCGGLKLRAAPVLRYGLTPAITTLLKERLWSAGLQVGLFYDLK